MSILTSLFSSEAMQKKLLQQFADTMKKNGHTALFISFDDNRELKADFFSKPTVAIEKETHDFLINFYNKKTTAQ